MFAKFGPAGNCEDFYEAGNKSALDMPVWLKENNLDCYEYQCGRGVKISDDAAKKLGKIAKENNILLSIHAPYYISLSSTDEEKRLNSIKYILDTLHAAKIMGADRIVVHSGSCGSITRKEALSLAFDTLKLAIAAADENGYGDIHICPETMGKVNQLGTLYEVLELCKIDERIIPCIDFGHLNARDRGILKTYEDFEAIFKAIENSLGISRLREFHSHFSKIEYSQGGEVRHLTFEDTLFGPNFEPVAELIYKNQCSPTIICESAGTQAEDAKAMKDYYWSIAK